MTIDLKKFTALQQTSKASFFLQKKLVKQVIAGQSVSCSVCKSPLRLFTPKLTPKEESTTGIRCAKGCTDIQLDFV